ncbi:MAG: leucyl aminopeptidase [Planctomycetes bacterium]|nr:leucyl aminopeptidase [Planctomycetota bacterium]
MKLTVADEKTWKGKGRTLVLFGTADPALAAGAWPGLTKRAAQELLAVAAEDGWKGKEDEVLMVRPAAADPATRVLLVGLGKAAEAGADRLRRAAAVAVRRLRDLPLTDAWMLMPPSDGTAAERAAALAEGALLAAYRFDRHKSAPAGANGKKPTLGTLRLVAADRAGLEPLRAGVARGEVTAAAVTLARDWVNEPAADKTPTMLAAAALRMARRAGLRAASLPLAQIRKLGMGALLGVAQGSAEPPAFITIRYTPPGRPKKLVALVGKGITFDSGGLCIKTADGMESMKSDMAGAATLLGVMSALPALQPGVSVLAILPCAENMPGGKAIRPGDVMRAMNGTTIEMKNTDAEGRLVLADGLCYAVKEGADEIIDVATLTGACVVALGPLVSGVWSNEQKLADRLLAAGRESGEYLWQMPLVKEYRENLKSPIADLKNSEKPYGGAIKAALFLQEFVGGKPWAHVDIAGPSYGDRDLPMCRAGGTGHLVRTLLTFLERAGG